MHQQEALPNLDRGCTLPGYEEHIVDHSEQSRDRERAELSKSVSETAAEALIAFPRTRQNAIVHARVQCILSLSQVSHVSSGQANDQWSH